MWIFKWALGIIVLHRLETLMDASARKLTNWSEQRGNLLVYINEKSLVRNCFRHGLIERFELWCWRRLLRVSWTGRRSNQSILKESSRGCSLEGLMLKLKLQYFCHLIRRTNSLAKTLMLGKIEGRRRRGEEDNRGWDGWMASPTQWTWVWVNSGSWWWTGRPGVLRFMRSQRVGHNWATELNC